MTSNVPSLGQKPQRRHCRIFLPSLPNSTLNLFLVTVVVVEVLEAETQISSFYKSKKRHGLEQVEIGKGRQGPSDDGPILFKLSNPVSKLIAGP